MSTLDYQIKYLQDHRKQCIEEKVNWYVIEAIDHALELLSAEKDGQCMVLPCKIGAPAYFLAHGRVYEGVVDAICMYKTPHLDSITIAGDACTPTAFRTEKVGKTVFFAPEAAKAALNPGESS
jgi:hypothetical protein